MIGESGSSLCASSISFFARLNFPICIKYDAYHWCAVGYFGFNFSAC